MAYLDESGNLPLFCDVPLSEALRFHLEQVRQEIERMPDQAFRHGGADMIAEQLLPRYLWVPLELHEDGQYLVPGETQKVPGHLTIHSLTVTVPYTGDPELWKVEVSKPTSRGPIGTIEQPDSTGVGRVRITLRFTEGTEEQSYKQFFATQLAILKNCVALQRQDLEGAMREIERTIRQLVSERVQRVATTDAAARSLNLPIRLRGDVPTFKSIAVQRRVAMPSTSPSGSPEPPVPGIAQEAYEEILRVIRYQCRTFEQTPGTYNSHGEEDLRNIILAALNCSFEGGATGETFRKRGKTDIRIEDKERAAFVAECKVWRGEADLFAALDQLLGYLTWRDCKTALVIFNKENVRFSELVQRLPAMLPKHTHFAGSLREISAGEWRCIFSSPDDESGRVLVHVFLFDLHVG